MLYFSTFISGLKDVVTELLSKNDPRLKVYNVYESLIIYDSKLTPEKVQSLPFLNNSFILFHREKNSNLKNLLYWAISTDEILVKTQQQLKGKRAKLRLMISEENQTVHCSPEMITKIENLLTKSKNIQINRSLPDFELWFYKYSNGESLAGLKLPKNASKNELQKGELVPELTYMLCYLSEPTKEDVFLDPFCGSGAIPLQRARSFDYSKIIAADIDLKDINLSLQNKKLPRDFILKKVNATNLAVLENEKITKIVTDPPWGIFEKIENIEYFYEKFTKEFARILCISGILIVLTAQKELFENIIKRQSNLLTLRKSWDILVSGKKAGIYKLQKTQQ